MVALVQPVATPLRLHNPRLCSPRPRVDQPASSTTHRTWLPLAGLAVVLLTLAVGVRVVQGGPLDDAGSAAAIVAPAEPGELVVRVAPGDTLWSIATVLSAGDDPRPLVVALAARNGGSDLNAGQELIVPADLIDRSDLLVAQG